MTNSPPARTRVFICYSQEDARYLRRLQTHLAQGVRDKRIDLWDDTMIRPGAEWQAEIKQAMQSARVAVLLVSVDFLASDFINETELPSLLEAVKSEGVTILPVLLSPCRYEDSPLAPYQFVNQPRRPLSGMNSSQRDENWVRVARAIDEVLSTPLALEALAVEVQPDEPPLVPEVSPDEEESPSVEAPSCSPIAERYRQALLNDQAITRLQVLGMGYHFPISDIYVRVQLHENMGASVSRKSTSQDPRALMQQKQRFLEERFTTAIDPEVAIRKYNHCIILGDPGAGKTTLLKYLATKSIENQLLDLPALPLYIRLNAFAASGYDDILAFAAATWASDYKHYDISKEEALAYIKDQVAQGNILLLLDALDEAAIGETVEAAEASYRRVAEEALRLANRCPWVVVTARKAGYRLGRKLHAFTELDVLDFRQQEIERFIDNWFAHHPLEARRGYAPSLLQELQKNPHLLTLAANPLLLTLITVTYEQDVDLPTRRAGLYQKCVDLLLSKWDGERSIKRPRSFKSDQQKHLLQEIAWQMHTQGRHYIAEEQITAMIAAFLPRIRIPEERARDVLLDISGDNGLLRDQAEGLYGFLHLTLQEYFAAQHIYDLSELLKHLADPWWEEVILLYAGQTYDASPLLEDLLTPGGEGKIPEDMFSSKLILAGRCLATGPTLEKPELWNTTAESLFTRLLSEEYRLTRQHIAESLAEIGRVEGEVDTDVNRRLLDLLRNRNNTVLFRICIADAIGKYGGRFLAAPLLDQYVFLAGEAGAYFAEFMSIVGAVDKLADRSLLPRLLELVTDPHFDAFGIGLVASQIGMVGNTAIASMLLPLLADTRIDHYVRSDLATSIGLLGDTETLSSLLALLTTPETDTIIVGGILNALTSRGYREAAPVLLPLITQRYIDLEVRGHIVYTLQFVGDQATARTIAPLIVDPAVEVSIRVACAGTFIALGIRTQQAEILEMLADIRLEEQIRSKMAFALAEAGDAALAPVLSRIRLRELDQRMQAALTIAGGVLGDLSVLSELAALFRQGEVPDDFSRPVAAFLVQHMPPAELLAMLKDAHCDLDARTKLAEALGNTDKAALVPDLLAILRDRVVIEMVRVAVADAVGMLGETPETARELLDLLRASEIADRLHQTAVPDAIYRALWAVSRRAGVMVIESRPGSKHYRVVPL